MRIALFLAALALSAAFAREPAGVSGEYAEQRSNRVYGCPCEFSSEWADSGRTAVLVWKIDSGQYRGEDLSGMHLVAVISAEFSLSVELASPRSTLFVDDTPTPARQRAALEWVRGNYAALLGRVVAEHPARIDYQSSPASLKVSIPGVLAFELRRADPARDAESWAFLLFSPLIPLASSTLAITVESEFSGVDLNTRWKHGYSGISSYIGVFDSTDRGKAPLPPTPSL